MGQHPAAFGMDKAKPATMCMPIRGLRFELFDPNIIVAGSEHPSTVPHNALHDAMALSERILAHEAWEASFLKN